MKWQWSLRLIFFNLGLQTRWNWEHPYSVNRQMKGSENAGAKQMPKPCLKKPGDKNIQSWESWAEWAVPLERRGSENPIHFFKIQTQAQNPRQSGSGFFLTARGKETPGAWPAAGGCVIRAKPAVLSLAVAGSPTAWPCCTLPAPSWDPFWRAAFPSVSLRSPVCYSASWLV